MRPAELNHLSFSTRDKGAAVGFCSLVCGGVLYADVLCITAVILAVIEACCYVAADAADALAVVLIHVRFSLNRIPEHPVI